MVDSYLAEFRKSFRIRGKEMSRKELATKSGLSISTIKNWEENGIPGKSLGSNIYFYSRALDVSIDIICHFSELQKLKIKSNSQEVS